ncbi:hypothetical protein K2173_019480 [Erythroxylum novogranatense]|uniref:RING-type E3 ubiquitin transferase n=1 Tax=Erythroxylum novogranatense TaxID=1862640 RepID=A0AAV8UBI6_9ROSI|nr:hypothetical protein K2173_019480 [Erythroxylum novogranatense]
MPLFGIKLPRAIVHLPSRKTSPFRPPLQLYRASMAEPYIVDDDEPYIEGDYEEELEYVVDEFLRSERGNSSGSETHSGGEEDGDDEYDDPIYEIDAEYGEHPRNLNSFGVPDNDPSSRRVSGVSGGEVDETGQVGGEGISLNGEDSGESSRAESDGVVCPICMEPWTGEGGHHICCLPCGHVFGLSCINKWIRQKRGSAKCPQCNRKCSLNGVRKLYAPRIAVVDEESKQRIQFLEDKCAFLEKKDADWCQKESDWQKKEAELQLKVSQLSERTIYLEHLVGDLHRPLGSITSDAVRHGQFLSGNGVTPKFCSKDYLSSFMLQIELPVEGARLFDIDAPSQILLLARRQSGTGGSYVLTKTSLLPPHENEDITLPSAMKMIKDLHISPLNGNLALLASIGKKLSVLSLESNNVVLSYDLPAASWSCSWDICYPNHIYAGLQNGLLQVFDMRQTAKPIETRVGISTKPIHTIHTLQRSSSIPLGVRKVISASSAGICEWNLNSNEERPSLIPETSDQGVCISLAHSPGSDDIVASYRPRAEVSCEMDFSQPILTPAGVGRGTQGSHRYLKRVGSSYLNLGAASATVSDIRLPKSTIIERDHKKPLFATGDEATHGLILQELPSFSFAQLLKSHQHFICDVKHTSAFDQSLLCCLSEKTFQLFGTTIL